MCSSKYPDDPAKQITDSMMILSALQFIGGLLLSFGLTESKLREFVMKTCIGVIVLIHALYAWIRSGYIYSYFTGVLWLYPLLSLSFWSGHVLFCKDQIESTNIKNFIIWERKRKIEKNLRNSMIDDLCKEIRDRDNPKPLNIESCKPQIKCYKLPKQEDSLTFL